MNKQKILIIGGLGYIGQVLYNTLKPNSKYVTELADNNLYRQHTDLNYKNIDVTNKESLKIIEDYDIIINLACIVGDPACLVDMKQSIEVNCQGLRNVVNMCNEHNKFLVHISTCSVYGSNYNTLLNEESIGFPIDFYGQLKWTQEKLVTESCKNNSLILRLGTLYGLSPRMRYDLVVNLFTAQAKVNKEITVFGGSQQRPFVHIQDAANAMIFLLSHSLTGVYNVANDDYNILEIGKLISDKTGCKININKDVVDKRNYQVSNKKLTNHGFKFSRSLSDDLSIYEMFRDESSSEFFLDKYSNVKMMRLITSYGKLSKEPVLLTNDIHVDDRGSLMYNNNFDFSNVKRFYTIKQFSTNNIRAFHGHRYEAKYVHVLSGSLLLVLAKLNMNDGTYEISDPKKYVLSSDKPGLFYIPPNYANGFKALESNTKVTFYSTSSLEDSLNDDIRFNYDHFGTDIWNPINK